MHYRLDSDDGHRHRSRHSSGPNEREDGTHKSGNATAAHFHDSRVPGACIGQEMSSIDSH